MRIVAAGTVALSCLAAGLQTPSEQPAPVPRFKTGVDVVLLDVSVLDRTRRPVRGLTAADFTILEDGTPQPLVSFEEMSVAEVDGTLAPWTREIAPDVRTNTGDDRRVVLLVLDDASASYSSIEQVRAIGHAIVRRLGPSDLAAVIYTGAQRKSQELTTDHAALDAAIDRFVDTSMPPMLRGRYPLNTLQRAAEYLIDAPHRRKALIFVSHLGLDLMARAGSGEDAATMRDAAQQIQVILDRAQKANVAIYPVNPMGLEVLSNSGLGRPGAGDEPGINAGPDLVAETLETISNGTGGFAIVNTNTFDRQIEQVFRETGSYYLLGFRSAHADGKFRRVRVRVDRPGLTVRTRSGYKAARPEKPEKTRTAATADSPLRTSITGILPTNDVPLRVMVAPFALTGRDQAALTIVLGVQHQSPVPGTRVQETVEALATAYDPRGKSRGLRRSAVTLTLRPVEGDAIARYEVLTRLDLSPGRYMLRFGVHSRQLQSSGSVYHDVDIPDFRKAPVSLSGIVISVAPGLLSAPKDLLTSVLPVVPTTQREFRPGVDEVTAFARVYQGGRRAPAAATVRARIVDRNDRAVFERTETIPSERLSGTREADYRLELPITELDAGPYLLTIEATTGAGRARRDVRFEVRRDATTVARR